MFRRMVQIDYFFETLILAHFLFLLTSSKKKFSTKIAKFVNP